MSAEDAREGAAGGAGEHSLSRWEVIKREWVIPLFWAAILAVFIRAFFLQAFRIPTGSMRPTLLEGDRILVWKLGFAEQLRPSIPRTDFFLFTVDLPGFLEPKRGDIIVFRYPEDPKKDYVKRLLAFGGEEVEIRDGKVLVNGAVLEGPPAVARTYYYNRDDWPYGRAGKSFEVPDGHYFVLGDNSGHSSDSRFWGFVPEENLIGKAVFIYWPIPRVRVVRS